MPWVSTNLLAISIYRSFTDAPCSFVALNSASGSQAPLNGNKQPRLVEPNADIDIQDLTAANTDVREDDCLERAHVHFLHRDTTLGTLYALNEHNAKCLAA